MGALVWVMMGLALCLARDPERLVAARTSTCPDVGRRRAFRKPRAQVGGRVHLVVMPLRVGPSAQTGR